MRATLVALLTAVGATALLPAAAAHAQSLEELQRLSVDDLAKLDVTSVTKSAQPLSQAPAAIYVISHDEIARSGATSLPEILRLAPNLFVAQTAAANYVITARGLSGNSAAQNFTNKLLVLIDGRSVYSPLFSGVSWDMQDVLTEDIDRVEVISGPGATLWGANAINGVINIITRKAAETQGVFVDGGAGSQEQGGGIRIGGRSQNLSYRAYFKGFHRDDLDTATGAAAGDHWSKLQGGFRLDWDAGERDAVTVQGDIFQDDEALASGVAGGNLLARWNHGWAGGSNLQAQAYFDREIRGPDLTGGTPLWINIFDADVQHSFSIGTLQDVVWGAHTRISRYHITGAGALSFDPSRRTLKLYDGFVQDTLKLGAATRLILGFKLEDDPYSGATPLPSVRLTVTPVKGAMVWAAVSRAIRSPTPFDVDVRETVGPTLFLMGDADFKSETLVAYEAGARLQPSAAVSLSLSAYYNVYDRLRSIEITPVVFLPLMWGNGMKAHTWGLEAWGNWQAAPWWRLSAGLNLQNQHREFKPGSSGLLGLSQLGDDPRTQAKLRSSMNLGPRVTFDADLRYVGALPDPVVPAYTELNARLGFAVTRQVELAISGLNLLHDRHYEWPAASANAVPRAVYAEAKLRF